MLSCILHTSSVIRINTNHCCFNLATNVCVCLFRKHLLEQTLSHGQHLHQSVLSNLTQMESKQNAVFSALRALEQRDFQSTRRQVDVA